MTTTAEVVARMQLLHSKNGLHVSKCSCNQLCDIFGVECIQTESDLKNLKLIVMHIHPDKSNLPNDYFIFAKHAYNAIKKEFETNKLHNSNVINECTIRKAEPIAIY